MSLFARIYWSVVVLVVAVAAMRTAAAPAPLVQVGQVYLIVESCTTSTGRCFGELHRVTALLENQWIETRQCEDQNCAVAKTLWRVNLAHVYAIRPYRGADAHDAD